MVPFEGYTSLREPSRGYGGGKAVYVDELRWIPVPDVATRVAQPEIQHRLEQDGLVEAVFVGNQKVPFEVGSGLLQYAAHLRPQEELNTAVIYRQTPRSKRSRSWSRSRRI